MRQRLTIAVLVILGVVVQVCVFVDERTGHTHDINLWAMQRDRSIQLDLAVEQMLKQPSQ